MTIPVLYADDQLVVLDKPSGLLSAPGKGPALRESLAVRVQLDYADARIVHRLDRDTSGLIVMARGPDVHRHLSRQFHDRQVEKIYLAVVHGQLEAGEGRIELALRKDFDRPPRHMIDPLLGRPAITDWLVMERLVDRTRLQLAPLTGRSHQLRVHLAHIGHPVLGDKLYAHAAALALADRLQLHATRLSFEHPATHERMSFDSPCPF